MWDINNLAYQRTEQPNAVKKNRSVHQPNVHVANDTRFESQAGPDKAP